MFQTIIEAFIEKHRAVLPEQCQEELMVLWSTLTTAYQGEVIRAGKARQEVVDATEVIKAQAELLEILKASTESIATILSNMHYRIVQTG
ncbi:MAG TPA: hypothetical protein VJ020_08560 [Anaerolineales bacterium]|nr:hypothetical protein [Anaerolineales bacterium]